MAKQLQQHRTLMRTPIELACLPDDTVACAEEVALFLGCSIARLRRWQRDGCGPDCLTITSDTAAGEYRIGDVRRWMAMPRTLAHERWRAS
jgi:hypothetical protein